MKFLKATKVLNLKKILKELLDSEKKNDWFENLQKNVDILENCLRNIRMKTDYFLENLKEIDRLSKENFVSSSEIIQNTLNFLNDPLYYHLSSNKQFEEKKKIDKNKMNEFEINDFLENYSYIFSVCPNKNFIFDLFYPQNIVNISFLYRGSENSFSSKIFHQRCDNNRSTLTFIRSEKGRCFGAYSLISWESNKENKFDENSFIFSFDERMKFLLNEEKKDNVLIYNEILGPNFGSDLTITDVCNVNNNSFSEIGCNYNLKIMPIKYQTNESFSILAGEHNFKVLEYEVYQIYLE